MIYLIFETPSKRCPLRHRNGQRVRVLEQQGRRMVRRAGARIPMYLVQFMDWSEGFALADELFIEPRKERIA